MRLLFSLFLILFTLPSFAQRWEEVDSMQAHDQITHIVFDNLSTRYLITNSNRIIQDNRSGGGTYEYQNNRLGKIGKLDITNPMKILVYYPLFQTLLTLDNTLSQTALLSFSGNTNIGTVRAICRSADNYIWIYDESNRLMNKIDNSGKIITRGIPHYTVVLDTDHEVVMWQANGFIFLTQDGKPVYRFDQFGKYSDEIHLPADAHIVDIKDYIYYTSDGDLRRYDYTKFSFEADEVVLRGLQPSDNLAIDFSQNIIYRYDEHATLLRWIP